jgi:outer membrane protein OmpA-like peptidoglycan-associated protein/tetratricopeptide (TPR) repeat protein
MKKIWTLFLLLLATHVSIWAQPGKKEYSIKNKKAIGVYEEALTEYKILNYITAEEKLKKAIEIESNFIEAYLVLAQVYEDQRKYHDAIEPLEKAMGINPQHFPFGWFILSEYYLLEGNYIEAESNISKFMPHPKENIQEEKRASLILSSCLYAKEALTHPVPFDPINLGPEINTVEDEYYPCITADENTLLFTRLLPLRSRPDEKQEDFYISRKTEGKWTKALPVNAINTTQNEGAPSLSADGQTLIFTACEVDGGQWGGNRQGIGSCDLFYSLKSGNGWSPAQNMGPVINSGSWESQPSFSADGRSLYFVRGRRTAKGIREQDIYLSYLRNDNTWTTPEKVPGRINTIFEEESVVIHPDGNSLYFSSNGHSGMGGLDIYVSHRAANGDWEAPINLGYPINTFHDENSIQVTTEGKIALFASDREGGMGGLDLYSFILPEYARPKPVTYLSGIISDKETGKYLEAQLELIDLESGKTIANTKSNPGYGDFLLTIPSGRDYALNVNKKTYLFHSENFSLKNYTSMQPYHLDIALQPIKTGNAIVLKNVFFETNQSRLLPASEVELNILVKLMIDNPAIHVEISGHTDNVGSDESNMKLSTDRAQSVMGYLIKDGGIDATRLTAKGYGESAPIATNDTEAGRALNRRTEFKIIQ